MQNFKIGTKDISVDFLETEQGSRCTVILNDQDPNAYERIKTEYVGTIRSDVGDYFLKSQGRVAEGQKERTRSFDHGRIGGPYDIDTAKVMVKEHFENAIKILESGNTKRIFVND